MSKQIKTKIIAFFTFIGGLYFFLVFLLPEKIGEFQLSLYHEQISRGVQTVGVMAIGLGLINILRVHGERIVKFRPGVINSFALLGGLMLMLVVELADLINSEKKALPKESFDVLAQFVNVIEGENQANPTRSVYRIAALTDRLSEIESSPQPLSPFFDLTQLPTAGENYRATFKECVFAAKLLSLKWQESVKLQDIEKAVFFREGLKKNLLECGVIANDAATLLYDSSWAKKTSTFLFQGLLIPLGSSMFALLAFYIATAAYRSFRLHSLEAAVMMIPAVLVILGQIPQGPLYISEDLPELRFWLLKNISTPAFRAITFGALIAGLAMSVRMWLSLEKGPLDVEYSSSEKHNQKVDK